MAIDVRNAFRDDYRQHTEPMRSILELGHPPAISMVQIIAASNTVPEAQSLAHLLRITGKFHASDPRDKIYALVGLCNEANRTFPVDYGKDYVDVLKDVVKFLIKKDKKLTILHGNRYGPNSSGPSWVMEPADERKSWAEVSWSAGTTNAAGDTKAHVEFMSHGNILAALGVTIGELRDVIGPLQFIPRAEPQSDISKLVRDAGIPDLIVQLARLYRVLSETDRETLWRTLVTDCDASSIEDVYPAPKEFGAMFRAFAGIELPPESFRPDLPESQRSRQFAMPFIETLHIYFSERCFFTTSCGRMGVGPYCTKAGDIAAVLFGSDHIMILRPVGSHYQLIGDAYIHGIMHGEFLRDRSGAGTQYFELC